MEAEADIPLPFRSSIKTIGWFLQIVVETLCRIVPGIGDSPVEPGETDPVFCQFFEPFFFRDRARWNPPNCLSRHSEVDMKTASVYPLYTNRASFILLSSWNGVRPSKYNPRKTRVLPGILLLSACTIICGRALPRGCPRCR